MYQAAKSVSRPRSRRAAWKSVCAASTRPRCARTIADTAKTSAAVG